MQVRRAVALGALVVIIVLIALGIHSCDVSSTDSALQNYTSNVSSLIGQSNSTGHKLFGILSGAATTNSPTQVREQVTTQLDAATSQYHQAQNLSVPDQVKPGNGYVVQALKMRMDGISNIAQQIEPALSGSGSTAAVQQLAQQTARFYASDVIYKDYAAPSIAGAVNAAGVRFSPLNGGQFVPDVQWVTPTFIASQLHVSSPGSGKVAPGLHGHQLNSVTVAGTTLQTGSTNTIPASPAPSFTLNFANTGTNNETNVVCKVTVNGTSVSGQTVIPQTNAGQSATCTVKLSSTPPTGTQQVTATVEKVPGEKNIKNNSLTFPVDFQ